MDSLRSAEPLAYLSALRELARVGWRALRQDQRETINKWEGR